MDVLVGRAEAREALSESRGSTDAGSRARARGWYDQRAGFDEESSTLWKSGCFKRVSHAWCYKVSEFKYGRQMACCSCTHLTRRVRLKPRELGGDRDGQFLPAWMQTLFRKVCQSAPQERKYGNVSPVVASRDKIIETTTLLVPRLFSIQRQLGQDFERLFLFVFEVTD